MDAVALNLSGTGSQRNSDVEAKASRLLQNWAQIAETRSSNGQQNMDYVVETYERLKRAGVTFPPLESVNAAMVETLTAPEWSDSDVCARCRTTFTTFNRKHHCRNCGNVFCHQCSTGQLALPWYGITQPVRVCQACYGRGAPPKAPAKLPSASAARRSNSTVVAPSGRGGAGSSHHHRANTIASGNAGSSSNRRRAKEDEDLELAIKLSLESSSSGGGLSSGFRPGYVPSKPSSGEGRATKQPNGRMLEGTDADDDPDLAAAIAASLRDYAPPQPSAPDGVPGSYNDEGSEAQPKTPRQGESGAAEHGLRLPLPPSLELPAMDVDALLTFSQTIASQEAHARQYGQWPTNTNQQLVQSQYQRATSARPKMARSLEEGNRRHGVLVSMHDKLAEAVKLYDQLLDAQMSRPSYPYYGQQQYQQQYQQQVPSAQPQSSYYGSDVYPSSSQPSSSAAPSLYPSLAQQQVQQQQPPPSSHAPSMYGGYPAQLSTSDLRMPPSRSGSVASYVGQSSSPMAYYATQSHQQHSGPTFPHMHHQMQQLYQAQTPSEASYIPTPNATQQQAPSMAPGGPYFGQVPPQPSHFAAPSSNSSYGSLPPQAMDPHSQAQYWQALQTLPSAPQQQPDAGNWANQVNVPTHEPGQATALPSSINALGAVPSLPQFDDMTIAQHHQQQQPSAAAAGPTSPSRRDTSNSSEGTLSHALGHLSMQSPSLPKGHFSGAGGQSGQGLSQQHQEQKHLTQLQPTLTNPASGPQSDSIESPAQSDDSGWRDIPINSTMPPLSPSSNLIPAEESRIVITPTAPPAQDSASPSSHRQQQGQQPSLSTFTSWMQNSSPGAPSPMAHSVPQPYQALSPQQQQQQQHQQQQSMASPGGPAQQWTSKARPVESSLIDL